MAFMKKKTKQRCKTILSLFFALTLIMSAVTFAVSAAEAAALSVQLKTDKEEYTADEDIALTLEIRNGSTDVYKRQGYLQMQRSDHSIAITLLPST